MRKTWLAIPAAACLAAALAVSAAADSTGTAGTIWACVTSGQRLANVNTAGPEPCPATSPIRAAESSPGFTSQVISGSLPCP